MNASNRWVASDGAQVPLYGEPEEPVVVTWRLEKGRVLWWAAPTPVTNSGISKEGNLPFFLGCIQAVRPGASPGETTVLWDEYFHGYRGSLWDYFQETPVPWAIFQLALVAVFVLLAFGRRSGPLYAPAAVSRLSPLEFVDTLGDLYRRASAGLRRGSRGLPAIPHAIGPPAGARAFDFQHAAGRRGPRAPGLEAAGIHGHVAARRKGRARKATFPARTR